jgi:hypothetical protein
MKKIIYLDTCQPDYFRGFSGDTLISFHWKGQTVNEAIESLKDNALNEGRDGETHAAIEVYAQEHCSDKVAIDEKYCEFSEEGDSGLVHYFGVIDED